MPFVPFYDLFPDLAKRETRVLTVLPDAPLPLPPGEYSFVELFCDESKCDCRRAFFTVFSMPAKKTEAIISWGWEDAAFYRRWFKFDKASANDAHIIAQMQGPVLDFSSPVTRTANALLELFANVLLADPLYVERVKKHYALFRGAIDSGRTPARTEPGEDWADADSESDLDAVGASGATTSRRSGRDWASFTRTPPQREARPKVGRNDSCPCGSGKKYKNCCLK